MRRLILLAMLLLFARPVSAQGVDHRLFYTGVAMAGTMTALDGWTTHVCLQEFPTRCRESNPVYRVAMDRFGTDRAIWGNLAIHAAGLAVLAVLHHKRPEWDRILTGSVFTLGGVKAVAVVSNGHTLQTLRNK